MIIKEKQKDIYLLTLYSCSGVIMHMWAVLFPYLASYAKIRNPDILLAQVFSSFIGYTFGVFIGNYLYYYLISILGYKNTVLSSILFNYIIYYVYVY